MTNQSSTKLVINGMSWNLFSRIFSNGSQLIIFFILARLLTPSDFGVIAILMVFINFSNIFAVAGLGASIIQIPDKENEKYDTIYIVTIITSIFISILLFFLTPFIAKYYKSEYDLTFLIRISIPAVIFNSINSIQTSILQRDMNFKKMFYVNSIPIITSGVVSIFLAYAGFGIYSLIINSILTSFIGVLICFLFYLPLPKINFNLKYAFESLNYSYKILVSALIEEINKSIFILVIGKFYNNKILGNYNIGRQIPGFASATLNSTIASVFFPFYVKMKSTDFNFSDNYRKSMRILNFIIFPFIFIMLLISKNFILFFFTEKWIQSIFYINMFSIILGMHHLQTKITYYINALGKSDVTLRYEFIKKSIGILMLILTLSMGIKSIVMGQLIVAFLSVIIMFYPTKKYLNISYASQIMDILPIILLNGTIFIIMYRINFYFNIDNWILLVSPILYFLLYIITAHYLNLKSFIDFINIKKILN